MEKEFHTVRGYQLQNHMALTPAMEDYLEMIFRGCNQQKYFRINELAENLNVRASSATKMVQKLGEYGFIKYKKYGILELTNNGKELGAFLLMRHNIIEKFLSMIGIEENLLKETELIEHYISPSTLEHLNLLNQFFLSKPDQLLDFIAFVSGNTKK